ncbi:MAG: 1-deoxy-D-xylulose-5-phosphate reductoisomerase [Rhodobacteraceae bacterium]|nr:1-deoxy-D-xylulose-5-phosphate reductoisomerase [Paracoccaceae bacterium]
MRRKISIFGATGSIGQNTVDLVQRQGGAENYNIIALSGAANVALLAQQAIALQADIAITALPEKLPELQALLQNTGIESAAGADAIAESAAREIDWAMSAIVGAAGLNASLGIARQGATLALANKESIVCAGELLLRECSKNNATLLPVDSEHSAIFQALQGAKPETLERIILTASGGPFKDHSLAGMHSVTPAQAAAHPKWKMGKRISIDSATMFNKALEVIEAKHLFSCKPDQIEVIIHPQSIIHSMVGFSDGAMLAHLGSPDMRGPIGYALNFPNRNPLPLARLDFAKLARLDFAAPDITRFPALRLAYRVLETGGLSGAVFNAAKEAAMDAFLAGKTGFLDMAMLVEKALDDPYLNEQIAGDVFSLNAITDIDLAARQFVNALITNG